MWGISQQSKNPLIITFATVLLGGTMKNSQINVKKPKKGIDLKATLAITL